AADRAEVSYGLPLTHSHRRVAGCITGVRQLLTAHAQNRHMARSRGPLAIPTMAMHGEQGLTLRPIADGTTQTTSLDHFDLRCVKAVNCMASRATRSFARNLR